MTTTTFQLQIDSSKQLTDEEKKFIRGKMDTLACLVSTLLSTQRPEIRVLGPTM